MILDMNQKGSISIVLMIALVVLAAALGYVIFFNKSVSTEADINGSQKIQQTPPLVAKQPYSPATQMNTSLTVMSPNGGETFKADQPIQIQWQPSQSSVFISLIGDPSQPYCLSPNQNYEQPVHGDATGASVAIPISPRLLEGNTCRFKIKVRSNVDASISDQSDDYFTVTP